MKSKKVVLLNYYFPPNTGVGGRRWVKFSKYLSKENVDITVFTPRKFILKNQPSWKEEADRIKNLKVIEVNDPFPKVLLGNPLTVAAKIQYRISKLFVSIFTNGNMYDPSSFWNGVVNKEVKRYIVENKIDNLIVSGIPFDFFYYASKLKEEMKSINLILDFRDLWTDSLGSFGNNIKKYQSEKRFLLECYYEKFSVEQADQILCASKDLYDLMTLKYAPFKAKFHLVNNGFDPEDLLNNHSTSATSKHDKNKISIVYIGSINCSRDYYLCFINALKEIKKQDPQLYSSLEFNFYGNANVQFEKDMMASQSDIVKFHDSVEANCVQDILRASDMVLYIKKEDELASSFASKFYDYLCARKYILILSPLGDVTEYIEKNGIGLVMKKNTIYSDLIKVLNEFKTENLKFNSHLDFSEFGYDMLSKKINVLLK